MAEKFFFGGEIPAREVEPGVRRQVLANSKGMTLVKIQFETGAKGARHAHPHEQVTYILSGRFRFMNDGEEREVGPGDSLRFAPDALHGALCLEEGSVIDVFAPCREDFL